jgi:hypothetical protein
MTGWNLPPGVSTRDLPGNEPEDPVALAVYDILYEAMPEQMELLEVTFNAVMDCVERARSTAYLDGGRDEAFAASLRRGDSESPG